MKRKILTAVIFIISAVILVSGGVAAYKSYNLKKAKAEAMKKIENMVDYKDYRAEQKEEAEAIIGRYSKHISTLSSKKEIEKDISVAKTEIQQIKTDAVLTQEEQEAESIAKTKEETTKKAGEKSGKKSENKSKKKTKEETTIAETTRNNSGGNVEGCVGNDAKNFY